MLDENKLLYQQYADSVIPKWRSIGKNELCNLYVDNEGNEKLRNAYMSAILCKYWPLIQRYYSYSANVASPEDAYEWLVNSVTYALQHKSWRNPYSSIYNDPNGPDKVINRCMKCARFTYYQSINRKKRKDGFSTMSLDSIQEDFNDNTIYLEDTNVEDFSSDVMLEMYIRELFLEGDYLAAILIDMMAHYAVFDIETQKDNIVHGVFNIKKLVKMVKGIDDSYFESFSDMYKLSQLDVKSAFVKMFSAWDKDDYSTIIKDKLDRIKGYSYFKDCSDGCKTIEESGDPDSIW